MVPGAPGLPFVPPPGPPGPGVFGRASELLLQGTPYRSQGKPRVFGEVLLSENQRFDAFGWQTGKLHQLHLPFIREDGFPHQDDPAAKGHLSGCDKLPFCSPASFWHAVETLEDLLPNPSFFY